MTRKSCCVFFGFLWSKAISGHPGTRITARRGLDVSGPIGGYGKDWCSARGGWVGEKLVIF